MDSVGKDIPKYSSSTFEK